MKPEIFCFIKSFNIWSFCHFYNTKEENIFSFKPLLWILIKLKNVEFEKTRQTMILNCDSPPITSWNIRTESSVYLTFQIFNAKK